MRCEALAPPAGEEFNTEPATVGRRALRNTCLGYLARLGDEAAQRDDEVSRLSLRVQELERSHAEKAPEGLRDQLERLRADQAEAAEGARVREGELRYEIDRLRAAKKSLEDLRSTRTNVMQRRLKDVGTLDTRESESLLDISAASVEPDEEE